MVEPKKNLLSFNHWKASEYGVMQHSSIKYETERGSGGVDSESIAPRASIYLNTRRMELS